MHTTKALRSRFIATALFGLGVAGAAVVGTAYRSDGPPAFVLDYLLASDFFGRALRRANRMHAIPLWPVLLVALTWHGWLRQVRRSLVM